MEKEELYHYGVPKRSGRYPYGSGERPYQSGTRKLPNPVRTLYNKTIKRSVDDYRKRKKLKKQIEANTKRHIKNLERKAKEESYRKKILSKENKKVEKAKKYLSEKYGVEYKKQTKPTVNNDDYKTKSNNLNRREIHNLSDKELNSRINRVQNEITLRNKQIERESTGRKFVNGFGDNVVVPALNKATRGYIQSEVQRMLNDMSKSKNAKNKKRS